MAYKTLEKVMPDANAWKVFYERNKQAAYLTDSTRGTTPIYQPIANLSAAKSAYGNIVYRKAPSFLKQAEFYLGPDTFQTAVRAFLKKHEFGNAAWADLVMEFENSSKQDLKEWARRWVTLPGLRVIRITKTKPERDSFAYELIQTEPERFPRMRFRYLLTIPGKKDWVQDFVLESHPQGMGIYNDVQPTLLFLNYQDYGYGIFLLDDKSRDYVLKNTHNEKDAFLRSMMWGSLWDSVREAELDPRVYVELAIKNLGGEAVDAQARTSVRAVRERSSLETDETIVVSILGRVSTALNYYMPAPSIALANARASATDGLRSRFEAVLLDRLQNASTAGLRLTFYRAFVNMASTDKGRTVLKQMLAQGSAKNHPVGETPTPLLRKEESRSVVPLRTKDKFDIVTRLAILGDPEAGKLLADLEKTETSDEAKRYAYAARAGFATAENKAKYWDDFVNNRTISESWIEAAFGPFNNIRHSDLTLPYLQKALQELPNHKRNRKIFFVNGWLAAFIGGQRSEEALAIVNKFLADNPTLDNDLRLKVLENVDLIERAVRIRKKS